ncbi:hypothetical protein OAA80_00940 [Amylibacter sp.]|jgi:hypothetical protein|nr:hypothetical protein [Amylibacter sp.]
MMRILHVASFNGNIGDVLSHAGLYDFLKAALGVSKDNILRLDLRRFYKNATKGALKFNSDCAENFNNYDLVIIGGGGFLKQSFEDSISGNTFDFDSGFFSKLKSKILFYSIGGINPLETVSNDAYYKTEMFIKKLNSDPRFQFFYRTDGSVQNSKFLSSLFKSDSSAIIQMFDSAYLNYRPKKLLNQSNNVVINIGHDQALESDCGFSKVISRTSHIIESLNNYDPSIVFQFIPHTYYDVEAFSALCRSLPESIKRNNLKCMQSFTFYSDLKSAITTYTSARLALTGRFHSAAFAFLFTGNFLPLYKFDRTLYQLEALGIGKLSATSAEEVIKSYNSKIENDKFDLKFTESQVLNRDKISSSLIQFLET